MNRAQLAIQKKFDYIHARIEEGPLAKQEHEELINILGRLKGDDQWSIGIRLYMEKSQGADHTKFLSELADQCMDDIFTMTCIIGQKAVLYLLRTVQD